MAGWCATHGSRKNARGPHEARSSRSSRRRSRIDRDRRDRASPSATAAIEGGDIRMVIVGRAFVAPENGVADVRSEGLGRVVRVSVREGDRVEPKQVLAEIERPAEGNKT